jgi:hypothetical protein
MGGRRRRLIFQEMRLIFQTALLDFVKSSERRRKLSGLICRTGLPYGRFTSSARSVKHRIEQFRTFIDNSTSMIFNMKCRRGILTNALAWEEYCGV